METKHDMKLTSQQKELLASLAHETGQPVETLIQQALDALRTARNTLPDAESPQQNGEAETVDGQERRALARLEAEGILHLGNGRKPQGVRGVTLRGKPMSETVLDARR